MCHERSWVAEEDAWALLALLSAGIGAACGSGEPRTDAERLARGRQIIDAMSAKLASAPSFIVKTTEVRDQLKANGQEQRVNLTREAVIRRPDRMYMRTTGDMDNEVLVRRGRYHGRNAQGKGVRPGAHAGDARPDAGCDARALRDRDALGDFAYTSPAKALLSDTTTGGWVGRETMDGQPTDHLAFSDTGVHWEIWIPAAGDPLPKKGSVQVRRQQAPEENRVDVHRMESRTANPDDRFTPKVPSDYEGIAILQRARVLKNIPKDDSTAPATGDEKK